MSFAKRLSELRNEFKLTQKELADKLGVSRGTIGMYEIGQRDPDTDTLLKLSELFNVSVDYLLGNTDIRNPVDEITDAVSDDPELAEFWNELKQREDLKLLFKQTRNLSPKAIKQVMRIIKAIEDEESGE
ncbi:MULTISPECIES: helix-turn-helix domain-containing protein [Thermoanaerobacterium]|uniref:XRE family transcriptional regulator n=2 Tax=Thermoanaerobacterium TaxID=28895 RepID=W9E812_9THEO|nr:MULTISPECIES: helix-turn-helix transcriptional regulator [Thermoanaerobacterium]AFK87451.1 transcriptional regulator, XRE family [Thermoanaerobacterium saccharolyticum JW/SL-YS485]ETO37822.1 XRE family transcriptional regulator [Thermoanaerobacterium aotearoense SCUT27]